MDLKRVSCIKQKYKDIIHGYTTEIIKISAIDAGYYNIPDLIKHMILLYYYQIFESKIVMGEDQDKFINLLKDNDKSIIDYLIQQEMD